MIITLLLWTWVEKIDVVCIIFYSELETSQPSLYYATT